MLPDPDAVQLAERTRRDQGLPDRIVDPAVLDAVVQVITGGEDDEAWLQRTTNRRRLVRDRDRGESPRCGMSRPDAWHDPAWGRTGSKDYWKNRRNATDLAAVHGAGAVATTCAWCAAPLDDHGRLCTVCATVSRHNTGVGRCVRCGAATVRYGDAGHPFCDVCRDAA